MVRDDLEDEMTEVKKQQKIEAERLKERQRVEGVSLKKQQEEEVKLSEHIAETERELVKKQRSQNIQLFSEYDSNVNAARITNLLDEDLLKFFKDNTIQKIRQTYLDLIKNLEDLTKKAAEQLRERQEKAAEQLRERQEKAADQLRERQEKAAEQLLERHKMSEDKLEQSDLNADELKKIHADAFMKLQQHQSDALIDLIREQEKAVEGLKLKNEEMYADIEEWKVSAFDVMDEVAGNMSGVVCECGVCFDAAYSKCPSCGKKAKI